MEPNITLPLDTLYFVSTKKKFLKVQPVTGDNLLEEDIREGFTDYCLWSTFRPECIDIDGDLDMECLDSGMVLFRDNLDARDVRLRVIKKN